MKAKCGSASGGEPLARGKRHLRASQSYRHDSRFESRSQGPKHGVIRGVVWRKRVRASVHLLRKPRPAWALDVGDVEAARACGVETIEIFDAESETTYSCSLAHFMGHAQTFERGHGVQAALPLGFWRRAGETESAEAQDGPRQLAFAGFEP